ncbi:MAG: L-serine ammonia-lyase, partial [Xanthomonadales bacterium]|nr:L-serine ammonia-lyase [Xanthomonadales bacterium]
MAVSIFELFKIGIGPSSSHTVGPMRAAFTFVKRLDRSDLVVKLARIQVTLFGSLAHTGRGHGTDKAIMLGLAGNLPDQVDPDLIDEILRGIRDSGQIELPGDHQIGFTEKSDLLFSKRKKLPHHPNGMRFEAYDDRRELLLQRDYYSVGGGFVVNEDEAASDRLVRDETRLPYAFSSGDELLSLCAKHRLRIADIMLANEKAWRNAHKVREGLLVIWQAMRGCMVR